MLLENGCIGISDLLSAMNSETEQRSSVHNLLCDEVILSRPVGGDAGSRNRSTNVICGLKCCRGLLFEPYSSHEKNE